MDTYAVALQISHLRTAITAALEAGKAILEIYHSKAFEVQLKADHSPLTKADIAAHKIIMSYLKATNIPVLSEEGKDIPYRIRKDWKQLWIVDPIDGTKEFIKRNGEFTVNIALIDNQKPVLGVIFVPVMGDLYFANSRLEAGPANSQDNCGNSNSISTSTSCLEVGQAISGAFKINVAHLHHYHTETLIAGAAQLPLPREGSTFTVLTSRSHSSKETESYIDGLRDKHGTIQVIAKGSSLKFCLIAEGQADCYPKLGPTMEWDTAAGQVLCEQAGVAVKTLETHKKIHYNRPNLRNSFFVVQKQMSF